MSKAPAPRSARRGGRLALAAGLALTLAAGAALGAPSVFPTGVTRYDPAKAYNGYVLFTGADNKTRLIDMDGRPVRTWDHPGQPPVMLDPGLTGGARGRVLLQLSAVADGKPNPEQTAIPVNREIGEMDWNGQVIWRWGEQAPGGAAQQHHDIRRLPNGETLVLSDWVHAVPGFKLPQVTDAAIYEVTPKGEITWRWIASEHLDELGLSPAGLEMAHDSPVSDYFHVNDMTPLGPNRWFRAGDSRFAPDNVLITSRQANFAVIIDKKTGKVVWRMGPYLPFNPIQRQVPRPVDQLSGAHDLHLIPDGLPGAGDLLVFDNQAGAGYPPAPLSVMTASRVLEIDPVTMQIVWQYTGDLSGAPEWSFHSFFISSARRLPNGDTLIAEGMDGRMFQVTPQGEIVWEYVSPYFGASPAPEAHPVRSNYVYRAQPVPYDWAPAGTPHAEIPVAAPDLSAFSVPGAPPP